MNVIASGRMGGKTTKAVEWVREDADRVLLVINEQERRRVVREFGLAERQVVIAADAPHRLTGRMNVQVGVDNIDLLPWRTVLSLGRAGPIDMVTETR